MSHTLAEKILQAHTDEQIIGAGQIVMVHHQLDTALGDAGLPAAGDTVTCSVKPETISLFDSADAAAVAAVGGAA